LGVVKTGRGENGGQKNGPDGVASEKRAKKGGRTFVKLTGDER